MKTCKTCEQEKPLNQFFKDKKLKDGHANCCKECKGKKVQQWREENRDKYNSDMRAYRKVHYTRLRIQRYKMTTKEYTDLLIKQNNKCAICGKDPSKTRPLAIDHDHKTNKTRALLCYNCNRGMHFIDNDELLSKMMEYKRIHTSTIV